MALHLQLKVKNYHDYITLIHRKGPAFNAAPKSWLQEVQKCSHVGKCFDTVAVNTGHGVIRTGNRKVLAAVRHMPQLCIKCGRERDCGTIDFKLLL